MNFKGCDWFSLTSEVFGAGIFCSWRKLRSLQGVANDRCDPLLSGLQGWQEWKFVVGRFLIELVN